MLITVKLIYFSNVRPVAEKHGMVIHVDSINPIGGKNFECLEIQDGDDCYFQIQKSPLSLQCPCDPFQNLKFF